jgi:outer membrane protein OmpA-like peptidoglycan-associated protein
VHRHESEKELCHWLTEVHGHNHHKLETSHHAAIYFNTGSAVPIRVNDEHLHTIGHFLHLHPQATAIVTAQTDTVGSDESNQLLSERRAETIRQLLMEHGAKTEQLNIKAIGEAIGADNTAIQENRVVSISINYPESYSDCPKL